MGLDDDMLGDYDILGALDDDMLGALSNSTPELLGAIARRRAQPRRMPSPGAAALKQRFAFKAPGVPAAGARRMPLGFSSFTFVNAGVTTFSFIALPQVPFKGRRLVIDIVRTGAAAIAVRVDDIQVGTRSQMAGLLAISASVFVPGAFDVDLGMDQCTPGTQIAVNVSLSAGPAVGDNVTVTPTLIGDALQ
jgi:hypothetical protein